MLDFVKAAVGQQISIGDVQLIFKCSSSKVPQIFTKQEP